MDQELALTLPHADSIDQQARLIALILDGVTSEHSRRSYRTGLAAFFARIQASDSGPAFSVRSSSSTGPHSSRRACRPRRRTCVCRLCVSWRAW